MVSLSSFNVASTLVSQSLSNLTSLNAGQTQASVLAISQTHNQVQGADNPFAVDLTQSLMDKQLQVAFTMMDLDSDQAAAQEDGSYLEAAFIGLAKSAYAKVSSALADQVEAENEKAAALAVEGLEVSSLENAKEIIDASDQSEGADAESQTSDSGEALDKQAKEAQEAVDALKELTA